MAKPKPSFMDTIVSLCKRRGFVFQASEIYGGIGNTYDYGPLGVELKRRIKDAWWGSMVTERADIVGLDSAFAERTGLEVETLDPLARMLPSKGFEPETLADLGPALGVGIGLATRRIALT